MQSVGLIKVLYTSSPGGKPVHSNTNSTSLGSIQSRCNYCADYSFTYPPLSIARKSFIFIQLSELKQRGVNEIFDN